MANNSTTPALLGTQPREVSGPAVPELPVIPGYDVLRLVGRGGMGLVYQARQRSVNRLVAVKLLRDGSWADDADRVRFRTEAEAIARLQHPNIVQLFEVGEWRPAEGSRPLPFFALEFCSGTSPVAVPPCG
jgi:serine/threonine protein kinase